MDDWRPGDVAICVRVDECNAPMKLGREYFVMNVKVIGRGATVFNPNIQNFIHIEEDFVVLKFANHQNLWYNSEDFRKRPDPEPIEESAMDAVSKALEVVGGLYGK